MIVNCTPYKNRSGVVQIAGLFTSAMQPLVGTGNSKAKLAFVLGGVSSGHRQQGNFLQLAEFQLLVDIVEKGMKLAWSEVFLTGMTRCGTTEEVNEFPDSVQLCRNHFSSRNGCC